MWCPYFSHLHSDGDLLVLHHQGYCYPVLKLPGEEACLLGEETQLPGEEAGGS